MTDTTDIVERLREIASDSRYTRDFLIDDLNAAADEIERLRAGGCGRSAEVSAAVLAEREACAKIADALAESHKFWARKVVCYNLRVEDCKDIAAAIRARSP